MIVRAPKTAGVEVEEKHNTHEVNDHASESQEDVQWACRHLSRGNQSRDSGENDLERRKKNDK